MSNHYDPHQPRDWHGRWTDSGGYVLNDIDARMKKIISGKKQVGESKQCVALVKYLAPDVGSASEWREGNRIKTYGAPPLERGTPIATFKNGRYPNNATGNHAAIFLEYGSKDGKQGIWVLDQSARQAPKQTFKPFGRSAEFYSVIKRR